MAGYVQAALHSLQHEKPKRKQKLPYPCTPPNYVQNNRIIIDNQPSEVLDVINQKRLQKIVEKFLYCAIAIYVAIFVALHSLAVVQTNPTLYTAKYTTHLLNYCTSHPDAVTEYKSSDTILYLYSNSSYLYKPAVRSRSGGYFFLRPIPRNNTPILEMLP